jgi:hypothetical protein
MIIGSEVFYPRELPKKAWFGYYTDHFDTVEITDLLPPTDAPLNVAITAGPVPRYIGC